MESEVIFVVDGNHGENRETAAEASAEHSKVRTPRQERSIKTKRQIIEAGMELFSQKGYHNTNSKEIAASAGVATGCFYSYFKDKRDVFIEALKIYVANFNNSIQDYMAQIDRTALNTRSLLKGLAECIIQAHVYCPGMHNEILNMRMEDREIDRMLFEEEKESIGFTYQQILSWKHLMRDIDLEAAAVVVYSCMHKVVDIIVLKQSQVEADRLIKETVDMLNIYLFQ